MQATLRCSHCGSDLPPGEFYSAPRNVNRLGRHSWCKACVRTDLRQRRASRSDDQRARDASNERKRQRANRLKKYGLTPDAYDLLLVKQGGVCAICGLAESVRQPHRVDGSDQLAVDHCHSTGRVRGLLCMKCNTAIGKLNDDPALLRRAADYLDAE